MPGLARDDTRPHELSGKGILHEDRELPGLRSHSSDALAAEGIALDGQFEFLAFAKDACAFQGHKGRM